MLNLSRNVQWHDIKSMQCTPSNDIQIFRVPVAFASENRTSNGTAVAMWHHEVDTWRTFWIRSFTFGNIGGEGARIPVPVPVTGAGDLLSHCYFIHRANVTDPERVTQTHCLRMLVGGTGIPGGLTLCAKSVRVVPLSALPRTTYRQEKQTMRRCCDKTDRKDGIRVFRVAGPCVNATLLE